MPTYEYACRSCEEAFEVFQSMRDAPLTTCPKCGKPELKRLPGRGAGIIFKGSGFYETDYKRSAQKAEASSPEKPAPAAAGSAAAGSGDSSKGSNSGKSSASSSPPSTASD